MSPAPRQHDRWLFAGFAVVVVAFAGSTVFQVFASDVRHHTLSLLENALPSIEDISLARGELNHLRELDVRIDGSDEKARELGKERTLIFQRLERDLHDYARTPFYPGEHELFGQTMERIAELRMVEADYWRAPSEAKEGAVVSAAVKTDQSLLDLIELNVSNGRQVSRNIESDWRRSAVMGLGLDGASLGIAVLAALLVWTLLKRYTGLARAHEEMVERRAHELEQFAWRVAHDLRNPLSAVGVGLTVADKLAGEGSDELRGILKQMQGGVTRAESLVDGLLAFASAGAVPAPGEVAPLRAVLEGVLDDLNPAAEPGLSLKVEAFEELQVACSPGVLTSILLNLLQNAVKYSRGSAVRRVTVRATARPGFVRVEVEDSGPGIDPQMQQRIFEPFVRIAASGAEGFGLGLATVKKLVEAHGGRTGVQSELGSGALFWFELPGGIAAETATVGLPH